MGAGGGGEKPEIMGLVLMVLMNCVIIKINIQGAYHVQTNRIIFQFSPQRSLSGGIVCRLGKYSRNWQSSELFVNSSD